VTVAIAEAIAPFKATETGSSLPLSNAYVDNIFFAFGDNRLLDAVHDKLGTLIGDGSGPEFCSLIMLRIFEELLWRLLAGSSMSLPSWFNQIT
jgi:hypothetical protein